jgi:HK97 family phage prohead protease
MLTKDFQLEIKSVQENGIFEGKLAVYNVVDEGNDLIESGAFSKTLRESGGRVPLLFAHTEPIGTLQLTDSLAALLARGQLVLSVTKGRESYDLLRAGALRGLSIGYKTIKEQMSGSVRRLKELRLFEGSLTPVPMNGQALVTSVKQYQGEEDAFAARQVDEMCAMLRKYSAESDSRIAAWRRRSR